MGVARTDILKKEGLKFQKPAVDSLMICEG